MTVNSATATPRDLAHAVVSRVAIEHQIAARDIMGRAKFRFIMAARHRAYIAVAEAFPKWSATKVARFFDRDHTTILHSFGRSGYIHSGSLTSPREVCQDPFRGNADSQEHSKHLLSCPSESMKEIAGVENSFANEARSKGASSVKC